MMVGASSCSVMYWGGLLVGRLVVQDVVRLVGGGEAGEVVNLIGQLLPLHRLQQRRRRLGLGHTILLEMIVSFFKDLFSEMFGKTVTRGRGQHS